jgi:hypothetical protein
VIEQLLQADRLLAVDQVDAAEVIYRRVSELDPMDAIAVVGLARVALARGDDRQAHELSARALGIDPANDMARRMEARLAEILVTRGELVVRPAAASDPDGLPMRPVTTPTVVVATVPAASAPVAAPSGASTSEPARRRGILARLRGQR